MAGTHLRVAVRGVVLLREGSEHDRSLLHRQRASHAWILGAALLALGGCSSLYLHDDKVATATAEAKAALERVSLGEQFTAQEKFLSDLGNRTREIELRAKLIERDHAIARLMDESINALVEFKTRRNLVLEASKPPINRTKMVDGFSELQSIVNREAGINDQIKLVIDRGGKFTGKDVCVAADAGLFDVSGVAAVDLETVISRIKLLTRPEGPMDQCVTAKAKFEKIEKILDDAVDSDTKNKLKAAEGRLKEIEAAAKKASATLKTVTDHLFCLKTQARPSAEIDQVLARMRDLLLVLGGKEVVKAADPAGEEARTGGKAEMVKGDTVPDAATCAKIAQDYAKLSILDGTVAKGATEPAPKDIAAARDKFTIDLKVVSKAGEIAEAVRPGLATARAEFLESNLVQVLTALAKDDKDGVATGGDAAKATEIATARAWISALKDLADAAAMLGDRNRPSLEAIMIEIAHQQYVKAEADAQIGALKKRVELLRMLRIAIINRAAYWGSASDAMEKLEALVGKPESECPGTKVNLARVIEACKGKEAAKHAADVLYLVGQSYTRGDLQAHLVQFEITNLDRKEALALDRAAFESRVALLKPAVTTLAQYGANGIKPSDIAQLLQLLGLGTISYGVN